MSGFLPLAFGLGAAVGAALAWWLSGRSDGTSSRRSYGVKVAALTAIGSIALTLAAVYGVVKWKFRSRPVQKASVQDAVKDFRDNKVAGATETKTPKQATFRVPGPGVYTYNATGYYSVDAPIVGKDRRELPKQLPGVLVSDHNCWALTVRFFKQHTWEARYCKPNETNLVMASTKSANEFFGRKVGGHYGCSPGDLVLADKKPGDSWTQLCKSKKEKHKDRKGTEVKVTYVADEPVKVGDADVPSRHIRRTIVMKGRQKGQTIRELWFGQSSGLLLKLREKGSSSGMATFESDWTLTLASTKPTK